MLKRNLKNELKPSIAKEFCEGFAEEIESNIVNFFKLLLEWNIEEKEGNKHA